LTGSDFTKLSLIVFLLEGIEDLLLLGDLRLKLWLDDGSE
jgi:hypothetical protein